MVEQAKLKETTMDRQLRWIYRYDCSTMKI